VVLERLESSGLSVREFAARERLNAVRPYRWRAQLRGGRTKPATFIEIKSAATTAIEIVLRSGHVVRVHDRFDDDTRRKVVIRDDYSAGQQE
jgi:hypothetical protein